MNTSEKNYHHLLMAEVLCLMALLQATAEYSPPILRGALLLLTVLMRFATEDAERMMIRDRETLDIEPPRPIIRERTEIQPKGSPYRVSPVLEEVPPPTARLTAFEVILRLITIVVLGLGLCDWARASDPWTKVDGAEIADTLKSDERFCIERDREKAEMRRACAEVARLNDLLNHEMSREGGPGHRGHGRVTALLLERRDRIARRCR